MSKEVEELHGRVLALTALTATIAHKLWGTEPENFYAVLERYRDNYTDIPFVLTDNEAEGFRRVMDEVLQTLQKLPPSPL